MRTWLVEREGYKKMVGDTQHEKRKKKKNGRRNIGLNGFGPELKNALF